MAFLYSLAISLVVVFFTRGVRRTHRSPFTHMLVLRQFEVDERPGAATPVFLEGRIKGFWGWLMTTIGLDPTTTMTVTHDRIRFSGASLHGREEHLAPIARITSTRCGYQRPISYLVWAAVFFLASVILAGTVSGGYIGLMLGAGIFVYRFFFSRGIWLMVFAGDIPLGLVFRPSVIEDVAADFTRTEQAIALINQQVLAGQYVAAAKEPTLVATNGDGADGGDAEPTEPVVAAAVAVAEPVERNCPSCNAVVPLSDKFCQVCGAEVV